MNRGFVKLWRCMTDDGVMRNHKAWVFWTWCLLRASHKKQVVIVGNQQVTLMPGQLIFGRQAAAEKLNMSEREIRTCLEFWKKAEKLTIKTTNKFSVISIVDWNTYQGDGRVERPANRPASDQQATTNKNVKNEKKEKRESLSPEVFHTSSERPKKSVRFAPGVRSEIEETWNREIGTLYPNAMIFRGVFQQALGSAFRRGHSPERIMAAIRNYAAALRETSSPWAIRFDDFCTFNRTSRLSGKDHIAEYARN